MSNNTLNAALRRLGYSKQEVSVSGFRATVSASTPGQDGAAVRFQEKAYLLAHPTRFERVTFAFGGQRCAESWRKVEEARSSRSHFRSSP